MKSLAGVVSVDNGDCVQALRSLLGTAPRFLQAPRENPYLLYRSAEPQPNEVSQPHGVANDPAPSMFVPKLPIKPKLPINKNELVSKLRNYIMSIDNEDSLK